MATDIKSLAYYASRAKKAGKSKEDLSNYANYHEALPSIVDLQASAILWQELYENDTLVPLDEIDLAQADFLDIVDQIYNNVPFDQVHLAVVVAPPPITHEPYFPKYLASIPKDNRTPMAVNASIERLDEVIGAKASSSPRGNGLIVGRVQSGKTRNYIGLMLKAVDEGWNVIIVLTSAITTLAKQTRNRIVGEFAKVGANNLQHVRELDFLSSTSANGLAGAELNGDFFYWGVSMKQVDGLRRIKKWLDIPNQPHASMRVLIIDDEADNATPDSNAGDQGNLNDEEITERIAAIRSAPGYEKLADWFDSLCSREWPDLGANTPDANTFSKIDDLLKSASKSAARDKIINTAEFRNFLGMDQFIDPPVQDLVAQFFNKSRGQGDDTCGAFVLLLKSILDIVRERSAINSAICALVGPNPETGVYAYPFARCAYLGYTATPYANILNEGPNHTPIYADFIQSLEISPQYFGTDAIFGHDIASPEPRMPIVCPITEDEESKIVGPLRTNGTIEIDASLECKCEAATVEWASLKNAVAWAFCTAAARRFLRANIADPEERESRDNRWTTMIVNISHVQGIHGEVKRILKEFLSAQCCGIDARATFVEYCKSIWTMQTVQFTKERFDKLFNWHEEEELNYGPIKDKHKWEDVEESLAHFLEGWQQYVHAIVINSTPTGKEEQRLYSQDPEELSKGEVMELTDDHLWIVSGGNTIGRGLTLPGLTVSYFDRVRDSTCVDTLTQMGRWFGYRPGYELLPRVWMNPTAVGEMKRIAALELRMHASIAENFAQHYSPADPAHFQQIDSWGREVSGRAFASRTLDADIGTMASIKDYFLSAEKRNHAFEICEDFVANKIGPAKARDPAEYLYAGIPLWENVDRNTVRSLLGSLLPYYPDASRKILRGIMRDISGSEPTGWDVVVGNPQTGEEKKIVFGGHSVHFGMPNGQPIGGDVLRTAEVRLHISFYAMIRSEYIFREDLKILEQCKTVVADAIETKCAINGGVLPQHYETALPGGVGDTILARLNLLIEEMKHDTAQPLPEAIHARLGDISQGFRNRSSSEYMARVHTAAGHVRPVLQLYLFRPKGLADDAKPMVNISIYWPGHSPDGFFTVCVDDSPDARAMVTPRIFCQNVEDILKERDFPVQRKELLRLTLERLGPRCNVHIFEQRIATPLAGFKYHKMQGRNAYCIDSWAEDEEQRLASELLQAAVSIIQRDKTPYTTEMILAQVIDEQPRFRDFFVPGTDNSFFNALMTDDILNANGITVTSHHPITYCYCN